jgi:hypothetical protein
LNNYSTNNINERHLQIAVWKVLSDPSRVWRTKNGLRLQVLSPGRQNVHGGPDFRDVAMLMEGYVIIGDAEFHRNSSEWLQHNHHLDENYKSVVLHIVFNDDSDKIREKFETLIIPDNLVKDDIETRADTKQVTDIYSLEDLQHFALLRLLRKTAEVQKILKINNLKNTLQILIRDYLDKYLGRRKRPVYEAESLLSLPEKSINSLTFQFLDDLENGKNVQIPDRMQDLLKSRIYCEGPHLRRELLLNCVLPTALCLSNEESRISLFMWYWSTPALCEYGKLSRQFRNLPQNFIWQQQGMLEYLKERGNMHNIVSEAIKNYGFAEILSFYRLGRIPFGEEIYERD